MGLMANIRTFLGLAGESARSDPFDFSLLNFNGTTYPLGLSQTMPGAKQEDIDGSFRSLNSQAFRSNGVIFACMDAHRRLFSEVRFQFRRMKDGSPGDLFGTSDLDILEVPWPNGTTGDLLGRMIQDADLAGNFYGVRRRGTIKRLRPDWVSIILNGPAEDIDSTIAGYQYTPGGHNSGLGLAPEFLTVDEVCHFAPIPDPMAAYRGMSWLTPLVREIQADSAATAHKLAFFENGATPNLVMKRTDELSKENFDKWVAMMEGGHAGAANAYRTLYLSGGADATVIGANMQQLEFKVTQGAGETRIAAAAGVPPIIVGLSEGLSAATYSNYGQARRAYADLWARPTWRNAAGSLASFTRVPAGAELWYDDSDIPFLAEDQKDVADIAFTKAQTIRQLVEAGFKPDSIIKAVMADDMTILKHSGLYSVQLQEPGAKLLPTPLGSPPALPPGETPAGTKPAVPTVPPTNGKIPVAAKAGRSLTELLKGDTHD